MKNFIIAIFVLASVVSAYAQDEELNKLVDIVSSLRHGGENAYKSAITSLSTDKTWTPMDELGINKDVECRTSDHTPGFRLNSVLTNAENAERYQTSTGNHLNGADSRYNYSLFEKTLKAGKSVSYKLNQRWGPQIFIIIPYAGNLDVSVSSDGQVFANSSLGNGAVKIVGNAVKGLPVVVSVRNDDVENVSYVIINYNSRK